MSLLNGSSAAGWPRDTYIILQTFRKRWKLIAALTMATLVASVFVTISQKRIYLASATIQIEPTPPKPLGNQVQNVVEVGAGTYWTNKEYYATQHKLLGGIAVARKAVQQLSLENDEAFLQNVSPGARPKPRKGPLKPTVDDAAGILSRRVVVEPLKDSRLAIVTYEDADPARAQRILTTLLEVYLERNIQRVVSSTGAASSWLRDQVGTLKGELEENELALHEYKREKRILSVSLNDQSSMLREEMKQLNEALTRVRANREAISARVRELSKVDPANPTVLPSSELLHSDVLGSLRQAYTKALAELGALKGGGRADKHPEVAAASAQVEETRSALLSEVRNIQGALKADLSAAQNEEHGLSRLFEAAKQRAMDLNLLEIEYRRLERSKENTEKLYGMVLERSKESDLTALMRFNNIYVVEDPIQPKSPSKPRVPFNLAVGLGLGLMLGVGAGLIRELMDRRLHNSSEVETELGVPCLGVLASSGRNAVGVYGGSKSPRRKGSGGDFPPELECHSNSSGSLAEAARVIRTNVLFSSPDQPYKRLLVTSASPGDGKTMVACTVAIAMAQAGNSVLLMDCDLRRSRVHKVFGRSNEYGVTSVTMDIESISLELMKTEIPNLFLLGAGPRTSSPAELLQSESFGRLLDRLGERFDRIVIDSPPVAAVTDPVILSRRVDGVLFVARWRKTPKQLARQALRSMSDCGARVVGCVLNGMQVGKGGYGYYYGYSYKSHYGSTEADLVPPPAEA